MRLGDSPTRAGVAGTENRVSPLVTSGIRAAVEVLRRRRREGRMMHRMQYRVCYLT